MIKISIVEDNKNFREAIKLVLSDEDDIEVISESENGSKFIANLENLNPDIVLMDISMPELNGIETTQKAIGIKPNLRILALSLFNEEKYFYKMVHAGVKGFVLKEADSKELIDAIHKVNNGESYFSKGLLKNVFVKEGNVKDKIEKVQLNLSSEELEIVKKISNGMTLDEISTELKKELTYLKSLMKEIYNKTNCTSEASLIMYALKNDIVEL